MRHDRLDFDLRSDRPVQHRQSRWQRGQSGGNDAGWLPGTRWILRHDRRVSCLRSPRRATGLCASERGRSDRPCVGAGGGSVAWFDRDGLLKAGPKSAGAYPGPACYGNGGTEPTTTDANLLLGRLSSRGLLDGDMGLDSALSRQVYQPIADELGFTVEKTAQGMLGIVIANMVRTIRMISVERGHDPRDFVLMPFGGAGPLHARGVAVSLGMKEMVVPSAPGIICAQGLLVSDLKEDFVTSRRFALNAGGLTILASALEELNTKAMNWFESEKTPTNGRQVQLVVDARYVVTMYMYMCVNCVCARSCMIVGLIRV